MNNKLLSKSTVLHASEHKRNKSIDNHTDSCYFIMVNSAKTILIKKNHLTCDHTTGDVLTTTNNDFQHTHLNIQNPTLVELT